MSLSLLRDFVLSVPLVLLLPLAFGVEGPLYSGPIADIVSFVATVMMITSAFKTLPSSNVQRESYEKQEHCVGQESYAG